MMSVMAIFQQPRHSCEYCAESQLTPQGNGWHDGFQDADCSRFDLVGSRGALAVAVASAVGTHLVGKRNHQTNGTHRWNLPILATLSTLRGRMVSAARIWYLSAPATSLVRPQPARVNECDGDFAITAGISPERRTHDISFAVRGLAMNKCPSARFRTGGHPLV